MKDANVVKFVRTVIKKTCSFKPVTKKISEDLKLCIYVALIQDVESYERVAEHFIAALADKKIRFHTAWTQYNKLQSIVNLLRNDGHLVDRNFIHRLDYEMSKFVVKGGDKELITITD